MKWYIILRAFNVADDQHHERQQPPTSPDGFFSTNARLCKSAEGKLTKDVKAKGAKVEKVKKAKPVKTVKAVKAVKAMKAVKTARPGQDINITPTGSHIIPAEPACMRQMPLFSQKHLRCLGSRLVYFPATGGRQKSRTSRKEGRQEGKGEGRKKGRKKGRKEGRHERGRSVEIAWK